MKFQTTVKKLAEDNICIIVTHDTSTIEICDKVYILSDGTVTEKIQSTTNKQKA